MFAPVLTNQGDLAEAQLTLEEQEMVPKLLAVLNCPKGEKIMVKGEKASFLGVLLSGSLEVEINENQKVIFCWCTLMCYAILKCVLVILSSFLLVFHRSQQLTFFTDFFFVLCLSCFVVERS
jgi:hypothetical protein